MDDKKEEKNNINHDILKWVIIGVAGFAIILLIFGAGMFVGGMKARFSYNWAESYHKNFAGPEGGFFVKWQNFPPMPGEFIESHGTFGEIIKIDDSDLVVKGPNDVEKLIIINENIIIEKRMEKIKKEDLEIGDYVVIVGSPNEEGQIEAKLIRVFEGENIKGLPFLRNRLQKYDFQNI